MPNRLLTGLTDAGIANATAIAKDVYGNPVVFIRKFPVGTPERIAVEGAYRDVQRSICISGLCITSLLFILSIGLRNPHLGNRQGLVEESPADDVVMAQNERASGSGEGTNLKAGEKKYGACD